MPGRRRWCAVTFVVLVLVLVSAPAAQAHASLVGSEPINGASLDAGPSQIRLWFDEPLRLGFGSFALVGEDGEAIEVRRVASAPDARAVVLAVPPIADGIYSVRWSVVSTIDSHVTEGTVVFGVGDDALAVASVAVPSPDAPVRGWEVVLRWLDLSALALLIGGLAVGRWIVPAHRSAGWASATIRRRALGLAGWAAVVALTIGIGLLGWQIASIGASDAGPGSTWSLAGQVLVHGRWATLWTARQLTLVALVVLVFAIRRGRTAWWPEAFLLVGVVVLTRALGSHAASVSDPFASVAVDAVHVAAAGIWVGGVAALLLATRGVGGISEGGQVTVRRAWRRFGRVAAVSVGILVVTGLLSAARQVVSLDALLGSSYGTGLLVKVALVAVVILLGLTNAVAFHPRLRAMFRRGSDGGGVPRVNTSRRRAIITTEVVLGSLILLAVGFVGSAAPARGGRYAVAEGAPPSSMAREVDDLLVTLHVTPNLAGTNLVVADVISTRRPAPAPVRAVALQIAGPGTPVTTELRPAGADRYQAPSDRLPTSSTPIVVVVERRGLPVARASFSWRVGTGAPTRAPVASTRPIGSLVNGAAALLAVLFVATLIIWTRPRQGRGRCPEPALARGWIVVVPKAPSVEPDPHGSRSDPQPRVATTGTTRWPSD